MFYTYLDLPRLPIDLETMCLDLANLEPNSRWPEPKNLDKICADYPKENFAKYKQYMVPSEVIRWLADNKLVSKDIRLARIHCMFDGSRVYPHFDFPRTYAINYLLTESTATTCFYKHKTNADLKPTRSNELFSLDEVELVESVVLDHHRWHRLDVTKIHNVENITVPRVALTLSDK